jgi:hypothetical protein
VAEPVEGSRLLSGCGGNTPPRVRIPASPPCEDIDRRQKVQKKTFQEEKK